MSTSESKDHALELAYASFAVFADDDSIDLEELNFLLGIALRDGKMTNHERDILANVFDRINEADVSGRVWKRIKEVRRIHGI